MIPHPAPDLRRRSTGHPSLPSGSTATSGARPLVALALALLAIGAPPVTAAETLIQPATGPNLVQRKMIDRRYGMFVHFGINTFLDVEWSDGKAPATTYAPTAIDTDQWVRTAREAGMRHIILTVKHHEGFCLWDSRLTDYDVAASGNRTDVVAALAKSCKAQGIELGIYYSLWDRREPSYRDDRRYVEYMLGQLRELMTGYGPICELWLDGGWDKKAPQWDIPAIYALVKQHQPTCAVSVNWTIGRPENTEARDVKPKDQREGFPFRYFPSDFRLGDPYLPANPDPKLFTHEGRTYYLPFESTVCLNRYWFFNTQDTTVKAVPELAGIYRQATAQDNILILNSPPNRQGVMSEANAQRLRELAAHLQLTPVALPKR